MAPECCTAGAFHGKLADVWAAGVSLYFMVHGKCPFISNNIMKLYEMIQNDPITYDESLPADLLDLLKHILERDPSKRYTVGAAFTYYSFFLRANAGWDVFPGFDDIHLPILSSRTVRITHGSCLARLRRRGRREAPSL